MKIYKNLFNKIIEPENLFWAWEEFKHGKGKKADVLKFEKNLEQELFQLHRDLKDKAYKHGGYADFFICDPKLRHIHKATVRDRVLHHAVYQILNPLFEPTFIATSFSCRIQKGSHKGVDVAEKMIRKVSRNYTRVCYVLKCDVRKFFDSIDHAILISLIRRKIKDENVMWLVEEIIGSFVSKYSDLFIRAGVPIGNLTSQLFANVYMNEFDQHMKRVLKVEHYGRYTDDFIVVSSDKKYLEELIEPISQFLEDHLKLQLHPHKVEILKASQSVDFLGYILRPYHRLMRKRTLKRVKRKLNEKFDGFTRGVTTKESFTQTFASYLGVLSHANTYKLSENLRNRYWFWGNE
jgi:retron-type reverse transcriptase